MNTQPAPASCHDALQAALRRLEQDGASPHLMAAFRNNLERFATKTTPYIREADIRPATGLDHLDDLPAPGPEAAHTSRVACFKLNGGLGTSMGLEQAKSLIPVKQGLCFLDIIARQILTLRERSGHALPLILMNSFSTEADTLEALSRYPALAERQHGIPISFLQHRIPKLDPATLHPIDYPHAPDLTWCPPGHGDFYTALVASGILDRLLEHGYRYAFISNADNLGATLDMRIPRYMADTATPFVMEVTQRTPADRKGGHLAQTANGTLLLRESAQCHPEEETSFQDIERHRYFNTNNLWLDLDKLRSYLDEHDGLLELPVMANRKTVDPRDADSPPVIQLETAMGAAIGLFHHARALRVPRARFAPVKTTTDLLALWSDLYVLDADGHLQLHPTRQHTGIPLLTLTPRHYKLLNAFQKRFPHGAPSLLECDELTIDGDHRFGARVTIRGRVHLPETPEPTSHPDDTIIEGTS